MHSCADVPSRQGRCRHTYIAEVVVAFLVLVDCNKWSVCDREHRSPQEHEMALGHWELESL